MQLEQLEKGYQFPSTNFELTASYIDKYLKAVEEIGELYLPPWNLVPPMAIMAQAMKTLSQSLSLSPGTIHVAQTAQFLKAIPQGTRATFEAKVVEKIERRNLHLLAIQFDVCDENQTTILRGKTTLLLPSSSESR